MTADIVDVQDPRFAERLVACAETPAGVAMSEEAEALVEALLAALERGEVRAAARGDDGVWSAVPWVKRGILLGFRVGRLVDMSVGSAPGATLPFFDKHTYPVQSFDVARGVRLVPGGSSVRRGAYLAPGVVCMPPMYVNVAPRMRPRSPSLWPGWRLDAPRPRSPRTLT